MNTIDLLFNQIINWVNMIFKWLNGYLGDDQNEKWILGIVTLLALSKMKNWGVKIKK